jgi:hypothetical protein
VIGSRKRREALGCSARFLADFERNWLDSAIRSSSTRWARLR